MEILIYIIKVLFVLFFIYTVTFVCYWLISLYTAMYRHSEYRVRKKIYKEIVDEDIEKDKVSVIIPAYNEDACICSTIDSILINDYPYIDIIVVNDGSTDKTEQVVVDKYRLTEKPFNAKVSIKTQNVLKYYEKVFEGKTIKFVCKENGGKSDSLNCGLNVCESDYCIILDADTTVEKDAIQNMRSRFVTDKHLIVCAGVVENSMYKNQFYNKLSLFQRMFVLFQQLEYFRTFYVQRIFLDKMNANVVVSGAFAMFDSNILKDSGGYKTDIIGEDMEVTMRLHAFCKSQKRKYHIGYIPEARCHTQVPFHYKDYFNQRRRWHIGMIQSLREHRYMVGSMFYGGAGIISGTFMIFYELLAPFIEVLGVIILIIASVLNIVDYEIIIRAGILYMFMVALTQMILIKSLNCYGIEKIGFVQKTKLFFIALLEGIIFHPLNVFIKLEASFTAKKNKLLWKHIERENEM